ncbi:hypothetical protein EDB89DRAFT_2064711 [Lactarius sanguifluus]|nr:hypothetical protein EDB89DRAFT_2064711 [Lactarius sanguifluus]
MSKSKTLTKEGADNELLEAPSIISYAHTIIADNCDEFLKALTRTHGVNERIPDVRKSIMFPYNGRTGAAILAAAPYGHERYHNVLPALVWHISPVMHEIETVRERYHYGTKKARLYRDIAVERRTWRDRLEDVFLFCVLFNSQGQELIKSLLVEWSDSNLLATVFVSCPPFLMLHTRANVAFLAPPNINALAQTASLVSTLFSILSIVMGVHHAWRHRRRGRRRRSTSPLPITTSFT